MQIRNLGLKSISRQVLFQNRLTCIISTVKLKRIFRNIDTQYFNGHVNLPSRMKVPQPDHSSAEMQLPGAEGRWGWFITLVPFRCLLNNIVMRSGMAGKVGWPTDGHSDIASLHLE